MIGWLIELGLLMASVVLLVRYYSEQEAPLYVRILVALSWLLSFVILLVLPLDLYETTTTGDNSVVKTVWMGIYYANFVLTWVVLPVAQEYQDAGQFTWKGRLKRSLVVFTVLAAGLVVYLIVSSQLMWSKIPSVLATTANLFGIVLVVVFLGHGLVSLPKLSLLKSNYSKLVEHYYRQAELVDTRRSDIEFDVEIEYRKLCYIQRNNSDPLLTSKCQQIMALVPEDIKTQVGKDSRAFQTQELTNMTEEKLANLHRLTKRKVSELRMYSSWLEELVDSVNSTNRSVVENSYKYKKVGFLALFVLVSLFSIMVFIGEVSTFIPAVEVANVLYYINEIKQPAVVYVLNSLLLLYIVYIISHSVFEMKVFGLYSLHKHHSTAASLLFTSINISRVSYPLCYNYLQITAMPKSAFLNFFGEISIGQHNTYIFPVLLIAFALFNLFDIYDRIMTCFGLGNFAFSEQEHAQTKRQGKKIIEEFNRKEPPYLKAAKPPSKEGQYMELGHLNV